MFKIGFDLSALDQNFKAHAQRGTGRYVRCLKQYFEGLQTGYNPASNIQIEFFDHRSAQNSLLDSFASYLPVAKQTVRQQVLYPMQLNRQVYTIQHCDALHFPAHVDAPAWGLKNSIVTVLDLIPLVLPELYRADKPSWRFRFGRWLELRAIQNAGLILAISENTARDVSRILGVAREKIMVTPLGVDHDQKNSQALIEENKLRNKLNLPNQAPIILYVGGIDPRKNWQLLIKATKAVIDRQKSLKLPEPVLVMVGKIETDDQYPKLLASIKELGLEQSVYIAGFLDEISLLSLYAISTVFFFPSLYEGFGLTPLEAMARGLPVVSSDRSCMPEILGDAALLFDPDQIKQAVDQISTVLEQPELRALLKEKGVKRAAEFTWEKTGSLTMAAYQHFAK